MNIDRYMVNLFFEIKRNSSLSRQKALKISNPDIGEQMVDLYFSTTDENIKLLVGIFLERAGEEWKQRITPKRKFYRGAESRAETKIPKSEKRDRHLHKKQSGKKKQMIYRGQVVE